MILEAPDAFFKNWVETNYLSQIQQALEELAFDSFYQEITGDFNYPTTTNQLQLPKDCFNIREVYLHNGTCCGVSGSVIVHPKRLFNNKPDGQGSTSLRKDSSEDTVNVDNANIDPIFPPDSLTISDRNVAPPNLHYYNIQNGTIMFSSNNQGFDKVRLIYNGMGGEIGDQPIIPRFFRQAVKDFVMEKFWRVQKSRERSLAVNWREANDALHNRATGSWMKAKIRISSMDTREREAISDYYSHGNW